MSLLRRFVQPRRLIERAARQALARGEKVPNLLAGHVAARPTGESLFKALRDISLVTLEIAGQHTVLLLLRVPEAAYARLAS